VPEHIRSNNGPEFTAKKLRHCLNELGTDTVFIEPERPWENVYLESFDGKMRDKVLNREIFDTLLEARVFIEQWRREYNQIRPHSALGYRPPAVEVMVMPRLVSPFMGSVTT
jgi:transposase InsO family protein